MLSIIACTRSFSPWSQVLANPGEILACMQQLAAGPYNSDVISLMLAWLLLIFLSMQHSSRHTVHEHVSSIHRESMLMLTACCRPHGVPVQAHTAADNYTFEEFLSIVAQFDGHDYGSYLKKWVRIWHMHLQAS